jgi:integrase/recombinase XerC
VATFLQGSDAAAPSPTKFNGQLSALRKFFDYLEREDIIVKNPAKHIHHLEVVEHPKEPLTLEEMLRLLAAVETYAPKKLRRRDLAIMQVFFHCALRVTEVVSINVEQVDEGNRLIRDVVTKGDRRLSVAMNDVVTEAIERYLRERDQFLPAPDEAALFLSQHGDRLSVRTIEDMVGHYAAKARISRHTTPHLLRHSSATELIAFTDIRTVQEHLHHKSVITTQRYTHVKESKERAAVDELGRRFRRAAKGRLEAA